MKKFPYMLTLTSALLISTSIQASHTLGGGDDTRKGSRPTTGVNAAHYPPPEVQQPAGRRAKKTQTPILSQMPVVQQPLQSAVNVGPDAVSPVVTVGTAGATLATTHAALIAQLTEPEADQLGVVPPTQPLEVFPGFGSSTAGANPVAPVPAQAVSDVPAGAASTSAVVASQPTSQPAPVAQAPQPAAEETDEPAAAVASASGGQAVVDPTSNGWGASAWRKFLRGTFQIWNAGAQVQADMFVDMTPQKLSDIIHALDIENLTAGKLIGKRFVNKTGNQNDAHFFDGYGVIIDFECGTLELKSKGFGNSDVAIAAWNPSEENPLRFLRTLITNQHGNKVMEKGPVGTCQMCGTYPIMCMELKVFPQNTYVKLDVMRLEKNYDEAEYNRVLKNIMKKKIERSLNPSETK